MNAFARVLDLVNVHVRGDPVLAGEGGIVEVTSRDGKETAVIAALPWVSERKVREFESLFASGQQFGQYAEGVSEMMKHLAKSFRADTVNILLAHVLLEGSQVGGPDSGERPLHMGATYVVKRQMLPPEPQYAALGHIHMPQDFPLANAYYPGSLVQIDFGEAGQQKRVNIVDVSPGGKAKVEPVALTSIRQLRNLGSAKAGLTLDEVKAEAESVGDAYLKVFVKADRPIPGLAQEVRDLLPNAVDIVVEHTEAGEIGQDVDIGRQTPVELFTAYYRDLHSSEPPENLMDLFNQIYEEVTDAAH
jgi:exonuclease SbcD